MRTSRRVDLAVRHDEHELALGFGRQRLFGDDQRLAFVVRQR